ncbi:MAG TPA: hypothetical protein PKD34_00025 [Candidatus Doudnabacteria bacterium]|nr:hypothetical protein [Candidatus Doudnabacteria bacterium]
MSDYRYYHSRGLVTNFNHVVGTEIRLEFEGGFSVRTFERNFRASIGQEVIVSWCTKNSDGTPHYENGDFFVSDQAIELPNQWERTSVYVRKYEKDDREGFRAEREIIQQLNEVGWRVEQATDFEDEKLGIDCWVFMSVANQWIWVPVDITIKTDGRSYALAQKILQNRRHRVITLRPGQLGLQHALYYALKPLGVHNIVSRQEALDKELLYTPANSHVYNILQLVPKKGL